MKIKYVPTQLNLRSHYFTLGNLLPAYEWVCEANLSLRQNLADQAEVILALKILFYRSPFVLCQCLDQLIWPRLSICERCRDWRLPPVLSVVSSWQWSSVLLGPPSVDTVKIRHSYNSHSTHDSLCSVSACVCITASLRNIWLIWRHFRFEKLVENFLTS